MSHTAGWRARQAAQPTRHGAGPLYGSAICRVCGRSVTTVQIKGSATFRFLTHGPKGNRCHGSGREAS